MTGKALPHQSPLIRHTWYTYVTVTFGAFFAGLALSTAAVADRFADRIIDRARRGVRAAAVAATAPSAA